MAVLAAVFVTTSVLAATAWVVVPGLRGGGDSGGIPVVRVDDSATMQADPMTTASIPAASQALGKAAAGGDTLTQEDTEVANAPVQGGAGGLDGLTEFIQQNVSGTVPSEAAASPRPTSDQQSRVFGTENGGSRLVLEANAPVWVRIEDRQGNVILTKTMMAGDAYRVPNRNDLVVIARDGGALTYSVDGRKVGTLGAPGEILVGRPLDLQSLERSAKS